MTNSSDNRRLTSIPCENPSRDPITPTLREMVNHFLEHLHVVNFSPKTIVCRRSYFNKFLNWCDDHAVVTCEEVTRAVIERHQHYVYHMRKDNGELLAPATQQNYLTALRTLFQWLFKKKYIAYNPTSDMEMPKCERRTLPTTLSIQEVEKVLSQPDLSTPLGLRDRAIFETFYSTGIRRLELVRLCLWDLDSDRGMLLIRKGKGGKGRLIPIGERAVMWVEKYLKEVRPQLVAHPDSGHLFLNAVGKGFSAVGLGRRIKDYIKDTGIDKKGACHILRHSMATLMLDNGADIRHIQEMLGHVNLTSTQRYTKVSISKLKEVHEKTHPASLTPKKTEEIQDLLD